MVMVDEPEFLTLKEAAALIRVHPKTLNRWYRNGWLRFYGPPRHRLVKPDELRHLLDNPPDEWQ
jgi:excisionase family DNA binding protein